MYKIIVLMAFLFLHATACDDDDDEDDDEPDICNLRLDVGSGSESITRYGFIGSRGCIPFTYKGNGGNANNFSTRSACHRFCIY
ncbi:kunitz-type serine protease inhibitor LmKTT-1c-like [Galleria mellonella]|uniref:Kunitz-type serine protease inhibitor LmKTT-1c-like n=1 Tax=Galleria mellonella TaxID=7137 RepID=A0ABM3MSC5_GALME|nr:kunitz-type serine protease inhibitor LmKTT-1c-like [Galleria mellonella]